MQAVMFSLLEMAGGQHRFSSIVDQPIFDRSGRPRST
jgi:hypothetical protein